MRIAAWEMARGLAGKTPITRHRGIDFLRAASILVVVLGHWMMAAPWVDTHGAHIEHMLGDQEWTQWLTWGLQVMPVFFFVGGYSNAISWAAACRRNQPWQLWLASRLGRLLKPVLPLLLFWVGAGAIAVLAGVPSPMIEVGSQIALVPTWFLAVYAMVILLVPLASAAWKRFGMASIWVPIATAALVDLAYFRFDLHGFGWVNYLFVWGSIHQLGFAWHDGRCGSKALAALCCFGGLAMLAAMTELGPWPRSLVGVPGDEVSNTTPPHLPILALAAFQFGAARLFEKPLRKWLEGETAWAATVLINSMIMTTFLWHSTVMMLLFGASILLGGIGLHALPGTTDWWLFKGAWIGVFVLVLVPVVALASRWERRPLAGVPASGVRQIVGTLIIGFGLAQLARNGIVEVSTGELRAVPLALPFLGAAIAGLIGIPFARPAENQSK
jgi:hypothetical protein